MNKHCLEFSKYHVFITRDHFKVQSVLKFFGRIGKRRMLNCKICLFPSVKFDYLTSSNFIGKKTQSHCMIFKSTFNYACMWIVLEMISLISPTVVKCTSGAENASYFLQIGFSKRMPFSHIKREHPSDSTLGVKSDDEVLVTGNPTIPHWLPIPTC